MPILPTIAFLMIVVGCAPPTGGGRQGYQSAFVQGRPAISGVDISSLPDTIGLEHQDRVNRFDRLSHAMGIEPPRIDQLQVAAGQFPGVNYAVPVVRVVFPEKVFFDFDGDIVKPQAQKILDIMAENMRRDVPDAQLLVVGHTDAIGSDTYNDALSLRRATAVMQGLAARGVNRTVITVVPMGKRQPAAPNWTDEGRAINRRVEFFISAYREANTMLLQKRRIFAPWLATNQGDLPPATIPSDNHFTAYRAEVPAEKKIADGVVERKVDSAPSKLVQAQSYSIRPAEPTPAYQVIPRDVYQSAPVSQEFGF
jgi:outer membrane protein OmpA-like peptidoglycan-associated protein